MYAKMLRAKQKISLHFILFLFFRTTGIYFELEYLQVYCQKFHLPPTYAYCAILYFHHYEFLFPELLSYLLNY